MDQIGSSKRAFRIAQVSTERQLGLRRTAPRRSERLPAAKDTSLAADFNGRNTASMWRLQQRTGVRFEELR